MTHRIVPLKPTVSTKPLAAPPAASPGPQPPASRPLDRMESLVRENAQVILGQVDAWASELRPPGALHGLEHPFDVLGLVQSCDLQIELPLAEGPLAGGLATVRPGTVLRFEARVRDGEADFRSCRARFEPALDGPLFADVTGLHIGEDGKMSLEVKGLPDPQVGPKLPAELDALARVLEGLVRGGSLSMKMLGLPLAQVTFPNPLDPTAPKTGALPIGDLSRVRVTASRVEFNDRALELGNLGRIQLAKGSKLALDGTLSGMTLRGHVGIHDLAVETGGVALQGARGEADLTLHVKQSGPKQLTLGMELDGLALDTRYAIAKRSNGDFISLAEGAVREGTLRGTESVTIGDGGAVQLRSTLERLELGSFEGALSGARLTVPDESGTAQLELGPSRLAGRLAMDPERVLFEGQVTADATLEDFQGRANDLAVDLARVELHADGPLRYDSEQGLSGEGLGLDAEINRASLTPRPGQPTEASVGPRSSIGVDVERFAMSGGRGLEAEGKADVDLKLYDFKTTLPGVALASDTATLAGRVEGRVGPEGFELAGPLKLDSSLTDGKLALAQWFAFDLKQGAGLHVALDEASFKPGALTARFGPGSGLEAPLDEGRLTLPGGGVLNLKDGTCLELKFDELAYDPAGLPTASGSLELEASISAGEVDLEALKGLPAIKLTSASGIEQHLRVELGHFDIRPDGTFEITDLAFGIEGRIGHLKGKLEPKPAA